MDFQSDDYGTLSRNLITNISVREIKSAFHQFKYSGFLGTLYFLITADTYQLALPELDAKFKSQFHSSRMAYSRIKDDLMRKGLIIVHPNRPCTIQITDKGKKLTYYLLLAITLL